MLDGTGAGARGAASSWSDIRGRASPRGGIRRRTHAPGSLACAQVTWARSYWTRSEPTSAIGNGGISTDSSSWFLEGISVASRHERKTDHAHEEDSAKRVSLSDHLSLPGFANPLRGSAGRPEWPRTRFCCKARARIADSRLDLNGAEACSIAPRGHRGPMEQAGTQRRRPVCLR